MIYVMLAQGFEEIEALTPVDVLRRAGLQVKIIAVDREMAVTGSHGIAVVADEVLTDSTPAPDLLILPGGMPGSHNLDQSEALDNLLKRTEKKQGRMAAICAAPLVLGHKGYLNGKKATCYPGFEKELNGAEIVDDAVVTDGLITTSRGMGTALLFGAELVRLMKNGEEAKKILSSVMWSPS